MPHENSIHDTPPRESFRVAFGKFLKADDLTRPLIVTVATVRREDVRSDRGTERKYVATFDGCEKRLILNKTNCEAMAAITGNDYPATWGGTVIELFTETTLFGGRPVPGIRLRAAGVAQAGRRNG